MPASEAQIRANQQNAQRSTGPKTEEGKQKSRSNSYKHGMTGKGVVMPDTDAAEVHSRFLDFAKETNARGTIGLALAHLAALSSVRMERGADQQTPALAQRLRQVDAEFVPPEGIPDVEAAYLHHEALRAAMLDTSKEAVLARKYEAANQRTFLRCLKELGKMEKSARARSRLNAEMMGPFLQSGEAAQMDERELDELCVRMGIPSPPRPPKSPHPAGFDGRIDMSIAPKRPG